MKAERPAKPFDFQHILDAVRKGRKSSDSTDDINGDESKQWGLHFSEPTSIAEFNLLCREIHDDFVALSSAVAARPTVAQLSAFLEKVEKSDAWLAQARAEIAARQALRERKKDLKKYLAVEQAEDVLLNLLMTDPMRIPGHFKTELKKAVFAQLVVGGGAPTAMAAAVEGIVDLQATLADWRANPALFVDFLIANGAGLLDVGKVAALSAQLAKTPLIPEDVAACAQEYIAEFQAANDEKMAVLIDNMVTVLEALSASGLFPKDPAEREKIISFIKTVRKHIDTLQKRIEAGEEEALSMRVDSLKRKCEKLHFWKPLSTKGADVLPGITLESIERPLGLVRELLGLDVEASLKKAKSKVSLVAAMHNDPEIVMAFRTYAILREHKVFSSPVAQAQFYCDLEAQMRRARVRMQEIAGKFKFRVTFQGKESQDAILAANQRVFAERKIKVARQLVAGFLSELADPAFAAFLKTASSGDHVKITDMREKVIALLQTLDQLKNKEGGAHNRDTDRLISQVLIKYEAYFPEVELVRDRKARTWLVHDLAMKAPAATATSKVEKPEEVVVALRPVLRATKERSEEARAFLERAFDESHQTLENAKEVFSAENERTMRSLILSMRLVDSNDEGVDARLVAQAEQGRKIWAHCASHWLTPDEASDKPSVKRYELMRERVAAVSARREALATHFAVLDPRRAAYLAAMTPRELKAYAAAIDSVEKNGEDALREDPTFAADIARIRREIAISMAERLMHGGDLLVHAELVKGPASVLYALSEETVRADYLFIYRFGDDALIKKFEETLPSSADMYLSGDHPHKKDVEQYMADVADDVVTKGEAIILDGVLKEIKTAKELDLAFRLYKRALPAKEQSKTPEAEKVAFQRFLRQKDQTAKWSSPLLPAEVVATRQHEFAKSMVSIHSPLRVMAMLEARLMQRRGVQWNLKTGSLFDAVSDNFDKQLAQLHKKREAHKQALRDFDSASTFKKFFMRIFSSPAGHQDAIGKLDREIIVLEKGAMAQQLKVLSAQKEVASLFTDDEKEMIRRDVILKMRREMEAGRVSAEEYLKAKDFIAKNAPALMKEFMVETSFLSSFYVAISKQASLETLDKLFDGVKQFESAEAAAKTAILLAFVKGKYNPLTAPDSNFQALKKQYEDKLRAQTPANEIESVLKENPFTVREWLFVMVGHNQAAVVEGAEKYIDNSIVICAESILSKGPDKRESGEIIRLLEVASDGESALERIIAFAGEDEEKLLRLFELFPLFSASTSGVSRDACFESYVTNRMMALFAQGGYGPEEYQHDTHVLACAHRASSSAAKNALYRSIEAVLADDPKPVWSQDLARLIEENFAGTALVTDYRILHVQAWCDDPELQMNPQKAQAQLEKFVAFMENTMKPLLEKKGVAYASLKDSLAVFVSELVKNSFPSYMHEAIVRQFGTTEQLQAMRSQWMSSALKRMLHDYEESEFNEQLIREMISKQPGASLAEKLRGFLGEDEAQIIKDVIARYLQKVEARVRTSVSAPVVLEGAVNDISALSPEAEAKIKLANSAFVVWLHEVVTPTPVAAIFAPPVTTPSLSDAESVTREFAAADLNALTKAYFHVSGAEVAVDALTQLSLDHMNDILLLPPEARAAEKERWLAARREEMRLEAIEAAKLTPADHASKAGRRRVLESESDYAAEEMIEYPFEAFARKMQLRWVESKRNEYDYEKTPDLYFSHYLLPVQLLCEGFVRTKMIEAIFDVVEKDQDSVTEQEKILHALSSVVAAMVMPVSQLNERHVDPIIALLTLDDAKKSHLHAEMLALGKEYSAERAAVLMNWCAENKVASSALSGYVNACKGASRLRQLMDCVQAYFAVEMILQDLLTGKPRDADIAVFLDQISQLKEIPALRGRLDEKIDEWMASLRLDQLHAASQLNLLVEKFGTSDQKARMALFLTTQTMLHDFSSDAVHQLLESKAPSYDAVLLSACMPILLARADELLSGAEFAKFEADRKMVVAAQHRHAVGFMGMGAGIMPTVVDSAVLAAAIADKSREMTAIAQLVATHGRPEDKEMLALKAVSVTASPGVSRDYSVAMQAVLAPYKPVMPSASADGLFGDPAKEKVAEAREKLRTLREKYTAVATKKFGFSDTSRIFDKKGQTYEGAVQEMQEKVLDRYAKAMGATSEKKRSELLAELHKSASYLTLDAEGQLPKGVPSMRVVVVDEDLGSSRGVSPVGGLGNDSLGGDSAPGTPRKVDAETAEHHRPRPGIKGH